MPHQNKYKMREIILCFFIIVLLGCAEKNNKKPFENLIRHMDSEVADAVELKVNDSSAQEIIFKMEFTDVEVGDANFVRLETPNDIIGSIDKVLSYGDSLFILDKKTSSIFIFKDKSVLVNKIRKMGRGEGEYLKISDFALDYKNKQIVVYSATNRKFIHYDLKGNFVKEIRTAYWGREFAVLPSGEYCLLTLGNNYSGYQVLYLDSAARAIKKSLPTPSKYGMNAFSTNPLVFQNPYQTQVSIPFSNKLYRVSADRIEVQYSLNLGDYEFYYDNNLHQNLNEFVKAFEASNGSKCYSLGDAFETDDYVAFNLATNHKSLTVLYSKYNNKTQTIHPWLIKDKLTLPFPMLTDKNQLVSVIPAQWLIKHREELKEKYKLKNAFEGLTPMSNALLIYYDYQNLSL